MTLRARLGLPKAVFTRHSRTNVIFSGSASTFIWFGNRARGVRAGGVADQPASPGRKVRPNETASISRFRRTTA
jgi:hypothetical protein